MNESAPPASEGIHRSSLLFFDCSAKPLIRRFASRMAGWLPRFAILCLLTSGITARGQDRPEIRFYSAEEAPSIRVEAQANNGGQPPDPDADVGGQLGAWLKEQLRPVRAAQQEVNRHPAATPRQRTAIQRLEEATEGNVEIRLRPENGTPMLIKGKLQQRSDKVISAAAAGRTREEITAREFLQANREVLKIVDPDIEFVLIENWVGSLGRRHLRFEQWYKEIPVWPCELIVHFDADGNVDLVNGTFIPTPAEVDVEPGVSADAAVDSAFQSEPALADGEATEPELIIHGPLPGPARLVWKFDVAVELNQVWRVLVDARTGAVLQRYSVVHEAAVIGSGIDGRGITRQLNLWQEGNTYYIVDTSKPMFDPTSQPPFSPRGAILIFDGENREVDDPRFSAGLITSNDPNGGWHEDAVGAAYGLSRTFDYYLERFDRNSLDGRGGNIKAIVRFGDNVRNAFYFNATRTMVFGFGFTRQIDISGHELTHGVTGSIGNGGILEYNFQPGALNEAFSDIFGEMVESFDKGALPDWHKADPFDPANLIQDYADPTSVNWSPGQPNPSRMSEFAELPITQDNGGVHINSSIINYCFYLLSVGMDGAIGLADAEQIFYRALTTHLQKQSQFIDCRIACINSAEEIFGTSSTQARKTGEAFDLVELFDAPSTPAPAPIPTIDALDSVLFIRWLQPFQNFALARRETALGDSEFGVWYDTFEIPAFRRVSISGDGSTAVFVTANNDFGVLQTEDGAVSFANLPGGIFSAAISPDASTVAVVPIDSFSGQPTNEITLIDVDTGEEESIRLLAPSQDGGALDIVRFADIMDFRADSRSLIYDALTEIPVQGSFPFQAWTLFQLDLETQTITQLIDLNEGLDFGNPSLGNARNNLLTYEVIDDTNISEVWTADLVTGEARFIARQSEPGLLGVPSFTGDDSAVVYTARDVSNPTRGSLFRQPLGNDGITPQGQSELWLYDAVFGTVYRRGNFVAENAPPQVAITSPATGAILTAPANFNFDVTASDSDGGVALVEFYLGGQKVADDSEAPFGVFIEDAPAGTLRLTARAIDNLGAAGDSQVVEVIVTEPGGGENRPPEINPIDPQTVVKGQSLTLQIAATDPDSGQTLTYSLEPGAPAGAGIDPETGLLTWTPSPAVNPGTFVFMVTVTDDGAPSESATRTFTVQVTEGTLIAAAARITENGLVELIISGGEIDDVFQIEATNELGAPWTTIATPVKTGETVTFIDPESDSLSARFYRISVPSN